MRVEDGFEEVFKSRAGRPHHHALAFEVAQCFDARALRRDEQSHIGRQGHDRVDVLFLLPRAFSAHGKIGDGGIGQGKIQFPTREAADIFLRAFGGFGRDLPRRVIIDHLRYRAPHHKKRPPGRRGSNA